MTTQFKITPKTIGLFLIKNVNRHGKMANISLKNKYPVLPYGNLHPAGSRNFYFSSITKVYQRNSSGTYWVSRSLETQISTHRSFKDDRSTVKIWKKRTIQWEADVGKLIWRSRSFRFCVLISRSIRNFLNKFLHRLG